MKTSTSLSLFFSAAFALPSRLPLAEVSKRDYDSFSLLERSSASFDPNDRPLHFLRSRALGDSTQNDVKNGVCKDVTVLFARGTTEGGNMGTLAGPPFVQAMGQMMGAANVAVQGIDYPADIPGFLAGGDAGGSKLMAQMVGQVMAACPTTNLVMAGYSQGGQLVHNAASMLSADETAFVKSAVIFGDPNNGKPVGDISAANTKVICHSGDQICQGKSVILAPHLTYSRDANTAAQFVASSMSAASAAGTAAGGAAAGNTGTATGNAGTTGGAGAAGGAGVIGN